MTVLLNQERYQSDRLTFERQQFEETAKEKLYEGKVAETTFAKHVGGTYQLTWIDDLWEGWKLAKGMT